MKRCYLIDSSIYIFRNYFSQKTFSQRATSQKVGHESRSGRDVSTVLAYFRWLARFIEQESPEFVAACFDESLGTCFRNEIDPNYKSNRTLPDDELAYQLLACKHITKLSGVSCYASSMYEADDLLASLFSHAVACGHEPIVVTRDKDLGQLLQKETGLFWDFGYDNPIDYDRFTKGFGVAPERIPEYLAIVGDTSDAIVGVQGVGKKTVQALFNSLGSWENIKNNLGRIPSLPIRAAAGIAKKIEGNVDRVESNLKLTRLDHKSIHSSDMRIHRQEANMDELIELLEEFRAPQSTLRQAEALNA